MDRQAPGRCPRPGLGAPGTCLAHGYRDTCRGPTAPDTPHPPGPSGAGIPLSASGLGMSAGQVATRPWASEAELAPRDRPAAEGAFRPPAPVPNTGSARLPAGGLLRARRPGGGARTELGGGPCAGASSALDAGPAQQRGALPRPLSPAGSCLPGVRWSNGPPRQSGSRGLGRGGQRPGSQVQKRGPETPRLVSPVSTRGRPRPSWPATCCLASGGRTVGTGRVSASQPRGRPGPGQRLRCPGSRFLCLIPRGRGEAGPGVACIPGEAGLPRVRRDLPRAPSHGPVPTLRAQPGQHPSLSAGPNEEPLLSHGSFLGVGIGTPIRR